MMDFVRRQPLMSALAAIAVVLLIAIVAEAQLGPRLLAQAPPARKAASTEAKLIPPVAVVAPEQAYPQTTARPLFTPTRRPAPPVEVAQAQAFQKGQFVLLGVTIVGNTRIAMLREKANGRLHRVEKGAEVNGIKVAEVDPDAVKMTQGGDSEVVALTVQKAIPGAVPVLIGPFAGSGGTPGFPIGTQGLPPQPNVPGQPANPAAAPPQPTPPATVGQFGPLPQGMTPPNPAFTQPGQTSVPMTPEELLARRRARRSATQ